MTAAAGDLTAPFGPGMLTAENLLAVREFHGDPCAVLAMQAGRFLDAVDAVDEVIGHQFGPIPAGLQVMFGLVELAVHHDDLAHATGGGYRPGEESLAAMAGMYDVVFGVPAGPDPWTRLLTATGR